MRAILGAIDLMISVSLSDGFYNILHFITILQLYNFVQLLVCRFQDPFSI